MSPRDPEDESTTGLPQNYRQGLVTAITVFLGFSLSFVRFWNFEHPGEWTWTGTLPAITVAGGIAVQLVALYRSLDLLDDQPTHYAATVRCFFVGIGVVAAGVAFASTVSS